MKKIISIALCLAYMGFKADAQFYEFVIREKHGISDAAGNEAVSPLHKYGEYFPSRKELALYSFDENIKDVIFNLETGKKAVFEGVYPDEVDIGNTGYTLIEDKGKKYLRSQESDKDIPLANYYYGFDNEGKYIIAKYHASMRHKEVLKKDKNGILMPPAPLMPGTGYAVLENSESIKPLMEGVFESYTPLYALPEEEKQEGDYVVQTIIIREIGQKSDFQAIVFSQGNTHRLYNDRLVLVKEFKLANANPRQLAEKASKIMKTTLSETDIESAIPPGVGIVSAPSPIGSGGSSSAPYTPPAVIYPVFVILQAENGNRQFIFRESETKEIIVFESKHPLRFDKDDNILYISDETNGNSWFHINPKTGAPFLPQKYYNELGLIKK